MPDEHDHTPMSLPSSLHQLRLLFVVSWRSLRRRAMRMGEGPKVNRFPTAILFVSIYLPYMMTPIWKAVAASTRANRAYFIWHALGVFMVAFGTGMHKGASDLDRRGKRENALLDALPLRLAARLGSQLVDTFYVTLLALVVSLAGVFASGPLAASSILPAAFGCFAYVVIFLVAQAAVAWARALGPSSIAKVCNYVGLGLMMIGIGPVMISIDPWMGRLNGAATVLAGWWLGGSGGLYGLYGVFLALMLGAYRTLAAAERYGFDRLDTHAPAPRAHHVARDRLTLERLLAWRQGGMGLLLMSIVGIGGLTVLLFIIVAKSQSQRVFMLQLGVGCAVYVGALLTLTLSGGAARRDQAARPFLSALPLAPHQVLDGKARAVRRLLLPWFVALLLLAGYSAWLDELHRTFHILLSLLALYVMVDGAMAVAFLSSGVGVVGTGGQASSSFSTLLLTMPLFTTLFATSAWAATVSLIAVAAITWEARRAAKQSVRWLDDPDDAVERETTVWRALLAATAFFSTQVLSARMLHLFEVPQGYMAAAAFCMSALVLTILTFRNGTRFERPRFLPQKLWAWPVGLSGGAISGGSALWIVKLMPAVPGATQPVYSTGESIALFATMVVAAPLAEEYFFRGWLQRAIERDLPESKKHWAFVLGGVAFALAHFGSYGVPQLVFGLLAGALFVLGGGLGPAILAHAMHNGVVLLAGSWF